MFWWAVGRYFAGGFVWPVAGADSEMGRAGFAGFCLLAGWLIGTVHGAVVLA